MGSEIVKVIAGEPYRSPEAEHGPCVVFCPVSWNEGKRAVLAVLAPRNPAPARLSCVVSYQKSRLDPKWAEQARRMRFKGISIRQIMKSLEVRSRSAVDRVLDGIKKKKD